MFWHARLLPLAYTHRGRKVAVLVSRSRDGELITGVIERLGFVVGRGSSSRGASEGVSELLRWAGRGHPLAITPDGPRGPAGEVKAGLVSLASRTGFPVIPVATAASASWVLPSWDGFRVPMPLSRVVAGYGPAIRVPPGLGQEEVETWRRILQDALHEHTRAVALRAGERT
jgi:lysophospholipid acyltransferase (LPLAT)-like uncharacterized protein